MKGKKKGTWPVLAALVCALACLFTMAGCKDAPVPTSLSVDTSGAKTVYRAGVDDAFDPGGIVAKVRMSDGTDNVVDATALRYRTNGGTELTAGTPVPVTCHTVTVAYNGLATQFPISVRAADATLTGVTIKDKARYEKTWVVEEGLSQAYEKPGDMKLEVRYSDRTSEVVDVKPDWISFEGWDGTMTNGQYTVVVKYHYPDGSDSGEYDEYTVKAEKFEAPEGAVPQDLAMLDKSGYAGTYVAGKYTYPKDTMKLVVSYDDGKTSRTVSGTSCTFGMTDKDGQKVTDTDDLTPDKSPYTVTVSYAETADGATVTVKDTYRIAVVDRIAAESISVSPTSGEKRTFSKGDTFGYEGLVLDVRYPDHGVDQMVRKAVGEDDADVTVTAGNGGTTISKGEEFPVGGDWTVTVRYTPELRDPISARSVLRVSPAELTCTYTVAVKEPATVESISIAAAPDKVSYAGDDKSLDLGGLEITAYMNDGTTKHVKWTADNADGITTNPENGAEITKGQDVTVMYDGKSAKFPVTYEAPALPDIKDVVLGAPAVAVDSDGSKYVWKVRLSSDVAGADYIYRYGTDYAGADSTSKTVSATGSTKYVDVQIPYAESEGMQVWLTAVEAEGYGTYGGATQSQVLPLADRTVRMDVDRTDGYDWKVTLSTPVAGSGIEYRYSTENSWKTYSSPISVFPSGTPDDVDDIRIEARVEPSIIGSEAPIETQNFGRVPMSVTWTYGYMDGANDDLQDTDENAAKGRYPTITATVPEGYAVKASLSGAPDEEYTDPLNPKAVKLAVTKSGEATTMVVGISDPSGVKMSRRIASAARTWTRAEQYVLKDTGPMGGTIVYHDETGSTWYETVVPERLKVAHLNVCEGARVDMEYGDLSARKPEWSTMHSCTENDRCQLYTFLHPFGGLQPQNLLIGLKCDVGNKDLATIQEVSKNLGHNLSTNIYLSYTGIDLKVMRKGLIESRLLERNDLKIYTLQTTKEWGWYAVGESSTVWLVLTYRPF